MGLVRETDLRPAAFHGPAGIQELFERLAERSSVQRVMEGENLVGLASPEGETLTLEPGGQFELSTAPVSTLQDLEDCVSTKTARLACVAAKQGLLLIGGGMLPVGQDEALWVPKSRYRVMRAHFAGLGQAGQLAPTMMQRTLSVQVTLDFLTPSQGAEMLRLAFLAAPVATAIFAASPLNGDQESRFQSMRAHAWLRTDPARTGEILACTNEGSELVDYVRYALDVPVLFRQHGGDGLYRAPEGRLRFRDVLEAGRWPDGSPLSVEDVRHHLSSVFTDARLKPGTIELRSTDGQRPEDVMAIPAFWVGLLYDDDVRAEAIDLLAIVGDPARNQARETVPALALSALWGEAPVLGVARRLVDLARRGLERRVADGEERSGAVGFLTPVVRRLAEGRTPADELLHSWRSEWGRERRNLVDALRFRSEPAHPHCNGQPSRTMTEVA
ncbi:MAG: hypothetical protein JKY65_21405 [Planctomycetes bacterium]|nr:hypothetical protein [Planctomycetota bacterium]